MPSSHPRSFTPRQFGFLLFLLAILASSELFAQYQKPPPAFGDTYSLPSPTHPEPSAALLRTLDIGLLVAGLGLAAWLVYKRRSRSGVMLLSIGTLAYFGFYRKGCICPIGAIQNVALCLVDPRYAISAGVIALFFLPLAAALLFGRVFCGGVCPLGAIQDLVLLRPVRVPPKLDRALSQLQYVYLALAVFFAGWGLNLKLGAWQIATGRRFLICEWDPFIPIFRLTGPFHMVAIGAGFVVGAMFIGRPYCRWLCPYGGILSLLSRVSWKNVSITPDKELDCGLCAAACPYGAIHNLRADRSGCLACTRCYDHCPRQMVLERRKQRERRPAPIGAALPAGRWQPIARTWLGILAGFVVALASVWLLSVQVHARRVAPVDKALVESLKEKAKTDTEIQKILQPELDRQYLAAAARRRVYDWGGRALLISAAVLMAWFTWLRPARGAGAGVPAAVLKFLEKPPASRKRPRPSGVDPRTGNAEDPLQKS